MNTVCFEQGRHALLFGSKKQIFVIATGETISFDLPPKGLRQLHFCEQEFHEAYNSYRLVTKNDRAAVMDCSAVKWNADNSELFCGRLVCDLRQALNSHQQHEILSLLNVCSRIVSRVFCTDPLQVGLLDSSGNYTKPLTIQESAGFVPTFLPCSEVLARKLPVRVLLSDGCWALATGFDEATCNVTGHLLNGDQDKVDVQEKFHWLAAVDDNPLRVGTIVMDLKQKSATLCMYMGEDRNAKGHVLLDATRQKRVHKGKVAVARNLLPFEEEHFCGEIEFLRQINEPHSSIWECGLCYTLLDAKQKGQMFVSDGMSTMKAGCIMTASKLEHDLSR